MTLARIGFSKYLPFNNRTLERELRLKRLTEKALNKLDDTAKLARLVKTVQHNLGAFFETLTLIEGLPPHLRFYSFTTDLLPAYSSFRWLYEMQPVKDLVQRELKLAGEFATASDIRLVMRTGREHLGIDTGTAIVNIEAAADILRLMGLKHATICLNAGYDLDTFRDGLTRLSNDARRAVVVESDLIFGIEHLLAFKDDLPIVVNLYTHWLTRLGEYLDHDDSLVGQVIESWRGRRPYGRLSPICEGLPTTTPNVRPSYRLMVDNGGVRLRTLATPGDRMWNSAVNEWACEHLQWMDIEVDAKAGFAAAQQLADHAIMRNFVH